MRQKFLTCLLRTNKQVPVGVNLSPCWETQKGTSLAVIALLAGGDMGSILNVSQHHDNVQYFPSLSSTLSN